MKKTFHRIYLGLMVLTVISAFALLAADGIEYYSTGLEERVFHADHTLLRPSGNIGHGLGIAGSLMIISGVSLYMARKRYRFMSRLGLLKHWLEFHIFLCTLGPVLILFHTAFKFGGLVAISFWSMVAVFLSGIAGRFIYLQIPRSIEGRELNLGEIRALKNDLETMLKEKYNLGEGKSLDEVRKNLKAKGVAGADYRKIISLVKEDIRITRRIGRLDQMQRLFRYWHVAHLPFALVMLIIMLIHVGVTVLFGYRWIF
jgi:hypothetical protein